MDWWIEERGGEKAREREREKEKRRDESMERGTFDEES